MHEFAERGIASHWKYKSSEKFNSLTWKEYDWLADLVEIIDKNETPMTRSNILNYKCFKKMLLFHTKRFNYKLPKMPHQ